MYSKHAFEPQKYIIWKILQRLNVQVVLSHWKYYRNEMIVCQMNDKHIM